MMHKPVGKYLLTERDIEKMWRAYNHFSSAPSMSKAGIKDMFDDFSPFFLEVAEAQCKAIKNELEGPIRLMERRIDFLENKIKELEQRVAEKKNKSHK